MPKIYVDTDEWYPVYLFRTDKEFDGEEIEVSDEELARLTEAFKKFREAQDFLKTKTYSRL